VITKSDGSLKAMSPLEALTSGKSSSANAGASEPIVTITPAALEELVKLRDEEPEADTLGLRLAIASAPGEDFRYDLSFDEYLTAAFTDEVRTHEGLKVIVPGADLELLRGATLDYNDNQGLVIRNPNRPAAPTVEGLTSDDELSAEIEAMITGEVNPALAAHGGFATLIKVDGSAAHVSMGGGCQGCAVSALTLRDGIEAAILANVPEITEVVDTTDHGAGENPFYS